MKKIVLAVLLSAFIAAPALAATKSKSESSTASDSSKFSVGAGYGFDNGGVLSLHGDMDISDMANAPVKARVGYDHYSLDYGVPFGGNYSWSYNVFYAGAYYDFNKALQLDKKIHPFAGLGFGFGSVSCSGSTWCNNASSPTVGGFYYIAGVQYDLTPRVQAELNFNGWGGLSLGANFKF